MATIRKVASEADVSIATVSRVLNSAAAGSPDVRSRVLEAATRLEYAGNRRSPVPVTNFIALAYTGRCSLSSPYDVAVLDGMSTAANETGADLVVVRLQIDRKPGESYSQMLHRKGARAAIIRTHADTREVCRELAREGYPSIVLGDSFGDEPVSYAYCDSRASSYQAVEHLISLGHRRIAAVLSHIPDHDHNERLAGYQSALQDNGIEVDPKLIHRVWALRPNGAQVVRTLMSLPDRPTALFIADPPVAVGAINQAHEMGVKIPEDLSIIGFDDADMRENVYPKMSAICQDARQLGYESMIALTQMLLDRTGGPVRKILPTWLELHGTTGQPPAHCTRVLPDGTRMAAVAPAGAGVISEEHSSAV